MNNTSIFALDIGTRTIAGLIMNKTSQTYEVLHTVVKDQLPAAMQDGQIHDIPKVAAVIGQVCSEITQLAQGEITQAAVAAAGRSLLTQHGQATKELEPNQAITPVDIHGLELSALQNALGQINVGKPQTSIDTFLCVGYSTIRRFLDAQPIENLLGHQGYSASVEIIATFLPRVVIDSLSESLHLAGLQMSSLTLEPIAAMHTVIPHSMRLLNLALVDIGAGTSDIAISANGTIKAYGMVSQAGDSITRVIADAYLLDFLEAEKVKCQLTVPTISCEDVLGNQVELSSQSVLDLIQPTVAQLAAEISNEIVSLNEGPPKGVMLIGGGSLTPQIADHIATQLGLAPNLVRIRERSALRDVKGARQYSGPQLITPICIGYHYLDGLALQLQDVRVNDQPIQLLKMPSTTVGDALINAGYTVRDLLGTPQKPITVYVNRHKYSLPGKHRESAQIFCNGQPASINTLLTGNDTIEIARQDPNQAENLLLEDLVDSLKVKMAITINGRNLSLLPKISVNRKEQPLTYPIVEGDQIEFVPLETVGQALALADVDVKQHKISIRINQQPATLQVPLQLRLNGQVASADHRLKDGDRIEYSAPTKSSFILSDIFRVYHQLDSVSHLKQIQFFINDLPAGYTHPLKDGDQITISAE